MDEEFLAKLYTEAHCLEVTDLLVLLISGKLSRTTFADQKQNSSSPSVNSRQVVAPDREKQKETKETNSEKENSTATSSASIAGSSTRTTSREKEKEKEKEAHSKRESSRIQGKAKKEKG